MLLKLGLEQFMFFTGRLEGSLSSLASFITCMAVTGVTLWEA